jgi:hypothetical protein
MAPLLAAPPLGREAGAGVRVFCPLQWGPKFQNGAPFDWAIQLVGLNPEGGTHKSPSHVRFRANRTLERT